MKNLIVITTPDIFPGEEELITLLFEDGLQILHLRKPDTEKETLRKWLNRIPEKFIPRIVLHDHFDLTDNFGLKGIHLNKRNPIPLNGYNGSISYSCHTLREITDSHLYQYLFLSPVFSSLSKEGYESAFSIPQLNDASQKGIICEKIIALGGITPLTIPLIRHLPFGGYAVLGGLWGDHPSADQIQVINKRFKTLQSCL